jgi:hypothetical protein
MIVLGKLSRWLPVAPAEGYDRRSLIPLDALSSHGKPMSGEHSYEGVCRR